MANMGIQFKGTVTNLRKAAATLTAKFAPENQDLISDFLCHSRKCHDKIYHVQTGHPNFVQAFQAIEFVQRHQDSRGCSDITSYPNRSFVPMSSCNNDKPAITALLHFFITA